MSSQLKFLTAVLLLFLPACGGGSGSTPVPVAQHYYVDGRNGLDTNSGSVDQPFRTISTGIAHLAAGDSLNIAGGDYRGEGTLTIVKTGSAASPVVVRSDSGGVLVDSVRIENSAWVELRGLTIRSGKSLPAGWPDMPAVLIDDSSPLYAIDPTENWSTRAAKVDHRYHSYSTFVDPLGGTGSWEYALYSDGINVVASQHIRLIGNSIALHTSGINLRNQSADILVEGNAVSYCLDGLRGDKRAGDAYSFSASTIRGNHLDQIFREGIRLILGASDNMVEDNLVENVGHSPIVTWHAGGDNRIRHNVVRQGGYYAETMEFPGPSGISVHSAGPLTLVDGNSIALQVDATGSDGNGVIIDNGGGDVASVVNNLIYRVMGSGISSVLSGNAVILHNSIVESGYGSSVATNGMGLRFSEASDIGNTIANNLIVNPATGGIWFRGGTLAGQGFVDNNLYDFNALPLVADSAATYNSLSTWQGTGHGLAAVVGAAGLMDPTAGDFGVQAGSVALLAGTAQHSMVYDCEDEPRGAPPTIGAYEGAARTLAEPRRFRFRLHGDSSGSQDFVAVTADIVRIAQLRAELAKAEGSRTLFINGPIERGGLGHNLGWDWHFVPDQWQLAQTATEVCDGTPAMVKAGLGYWVDSVGQFCPWSAFVKAEL